MSLSQLFNHQEFIARHIGPCESEKADMLAAIGVSSVEDLVAQTVPAGIRFNRALDLPPAMREADALAALKTVASKNIVNKSFIGLGYYPVQVPGVILRNVLENPGWYTAYTPYQAEIAQGRLEALLNFQQMVIDLTGLELANASLLDEATAAAEAMTLARRVSKVKSEQFFVDRRVLPQTLDVLKTRAEYFGFELVLGHPEEAGNGDYFGALFQYPGESGELLDLTPYIAAAKARGAVAIVAADVMALVALKSPAEMGADVAVGNTQRFGVPMGFGGPHAAYFAFRDDMKRSAAGRIIGVSIDAKGKTALRMALQTREQHIRREKANSNICTSQVLLANMAGMYAVYHGPEGVKRIATRIHRLAAIFAHAVKTAGGKLVFDRFYDTVQVDLGDRAANVYAALLAAGINVRDAGNGVLGVAFHEAATEADLAQLIELFTGKAADIAALDAAASDAIPAALKRESAILSHPVFNEHHSEHEMLRYLKKLENRDLAMNHSMISLGSCTMKLNATSEMIPVTWPEFANMHPFAPRDQAVGYLEMIEGLQQQLLAITGFDAISMQPNSGAQGEYAGLLAIRRYHASRGEAHRSVCLIPQSAHGTNPATAQMLGMQVVVVKTDDNGNVDMADLKARVEQHAANLGALMITYPSTHGVFEQGIKEICEMVHAAGGQVYMDGANMNAQVGLTRPADIGADVLHMNLHKTFCIPHGGGGPGMGPIGMKSHLAPFMANHVVSEVPGAVAGQSAVSAAPFGSASILPISYMYIAMMGAEGMKHATEMALLNANYLMQNLSAHYPVLYTGANGRVAHECIIDLRPLKAASGVTEVDVAKRLMDYGFHAPTMSFPVAGTLMIEPTESESKAELDRFIAAMVAIRQEIDKVQSGVWPLNDNPLVNAPHSKADITGEWTRAYSREEAFFPLPYVLDNKFWPSVNRIDDVYGDRNLVCSCPSVEEYE
ncbi:glycine dehydrogenase (decarboxylating) alpha subunit /glycine dehydrogenase (decarboxylating) beta subunit [Vogesella indigofera]|uniref:Glycine dehydrogenase (decarboxylating) n=1 Tax=Vogesella indigofera TaxID=45465 RepID=A0A495B456_VOGIN|nr:aminomethyl-transferring glycine dehydrogenase [Vogesella indigofera]RKQ55470.1 glycine dehydrogenase (decarboxylating) alpha subunit /glycine dehydrogenase (decarboxylating) beta subunit [Vogesella indigofera]